ncbi:MAG: flagellar basal-body rod protein FlgF [Candidatus Magnetominusculus sp. LBB02]|nr:flagellar basal-body rod protein FlgF [Candidatus Magnetominusculus sp. LBB02]
MISSLWSAVSGMNSTSSALDVVSDNIANMNTTGFKGSRTSFGDVLSQYIGSAGQVGSGASLSKIATSMTQGSLVTTGNTYDMAIDGTGFFVVKNTSTGATDYTRAGNFSVDKNGYLVTASGLRVQGYMGTDVNATASNTNNGVLTDIKIQTTVSAAKATNNVVTGVNLNSQASVISAAFTLDGNGDGVNNDPMNYNYSQTTTVYDSQGASHQVTAYFTKVGDNSWQVHYAYPASSSQASSSSPSLIMASGDVQTLTFNTSGALVSDGSSSSKTTSPTQYFDFSGSAAQSQGISFDFGQSISQGGTGLSGTVQLAEGNQALSSSQNGYSAGSVKTVTIADDGTITATMSNGQISTLGQIVLARFNNPGALTKVSDNIWMASKDSGTALINVAKSDGLGRVVSGSLESSNVDLSAEFVNMITYQRAYEASSKGVQTVNEMLQTLNALKQG